MTAGWIRRLVSVAAVLALWQLLAVSGRIPTEYFPGVPQVAAALGETLGDRQFWPNELLTLGRSALALLLAITIALGAALAGARWTWVGRALSPLVELFRSMPPAPLVPLAIFALGLGPRLFLFIITFAAIWPIYIGASNALQASEPVQAQAARSLGLTDSELLWRVRMPAALPEIYSAIRIAAGVCLIASIAVEMLAGTSGIGAMLFTSAFSLRTAETFALLFVAGVNGMLFNQLVVWARQRQCGWHQQLSATADA